MKKIDNAARTITVSKDFLTKAGQFGTLEFYEALQMKQDFPGYALVERKIKRNPEKRTYGRLTYAAMESFIRGREMDEQVCKSRLAEFESIKRWAKTQNAAYVRVKEWFLNEYKDEFTNAVENPISVTK